MSLILGCGELSPLGYPDGDDDSGNQKRSMDELEI